METVLPTPRWTRSQNLRAFCTGVLLVAATLLTSCGGAEPASPEQRVGSVEVRISTKSVMVAQGGMWGFTANVAVIWSVREGAAGGTITDQGVYTAPQTDGTFHVVATSQVNSTKSDTATVTVPSVAVAIRPSAIGLIAGQNFTFAADITGTINTTATWSVQEGLAGGTITDLGQYTAPSTPGAFHVVATSVADATRSGIATVTVVSAPTALMASGNMTAGRAFHSGTLLPDGRVLIAGGISEVTDDCGCGLPLASADMFDPASGTFSGAAQMTQARSGHTATLLLNGKVLLVGGAVDLTAELFDPPNGTFVATGSMKMNRGGHTATLLRNGRVLITGGAGTQTTELFDPSTGTFSSAANMTTTRTSHTATLLLDGRVLITGGIDISGGVLATAELFDPAGGNFVATGSMTLGRASHTATLLPDGRVLIAGGSGGSAGSPFTTSEPLATTELFEPATGTFAAAGNMITARSSHTATALASGKVFITGGAFSSLAELFDPVSGDFTVVGKMMTIRFGHAATLLSNRAVLISGGFDDSGSEQAVASTELYVPQ